MTYRATIILSALLCALLLALYVASPVRTPPEQVAELAAPSDATRELEEALDREEAAKLRRLREEQESRRRESARKLEAEQSRQSEMTRLRTTVMNLEHRESTLHHDVRSTQQQLGALSRDPADHSSAARRSELERQLGYSQNQLDYATRSRESTAKQLDALRFRY